MIQSHQPLGYESSSSEAEALEICETSNATTVNSSSIFCATISVAYATTKFFYNGDGRYDFFDSSDTGEDAVQKYTAVVSAYETYRCKHQVDR